MTGQDIPTRLQILIDRQDIHDCIIRYCHGVDRADKALLLSAYHEDAQDDHAVFCGTAAAFADWAIEHHDRTMTSHNHYVLNHSCELDGNTAHTETYWLCAAINKEVPPTLSGGRYIDRFEKRAERWAIADRKCLIEWTVTAENVPMPEAYIAALRSAGVSARNRSDTSYERPLAVTSKHRVFSY